MLVRPSKEERLAAFAGLLDDLRLFSAKLEEPASAGGPFFFGARARSCNTARRRPPQKSASLPSASDHLAMQARTCRWWTSR